MLIIKQEKVDAIIMAKRRFKENPNTRMYELGAKFLITDEVRRDLKEVPFPKINTSMMHRLASVTRS
jgi:hypothetical protein